MNCRDRTCLVVGEGLTDLVAATILEREGLQVTVLDKGRGIGGRLATRCIRGHAPGESVFDCGAQFFTVRAPVFGPGSTNPGGQLLPCRLDASPWETILWVCGLCGIL